MGTWIQPSQATAAVGCEPTNRRSVSLSHPGLPHCPDQIQPAFVLALLSQTLRLEERNNQASSEPPKFCLPHSYLCYPSIQPALHVAVDEFHLFFSKQLRIRPSWCPVAPAGFRSFEAERQKPAARVDTESVSRKARVLQSPAPDCDSLLMQTLAGSSDSSSSGVPVTCLGDLS